MKIQSNGSFLEVSTSDGIFHMSAQVKLVNLLVMYVIFGCIGFLKFKLMTRKK